MRDKIFYTICFGFLFGVLIRSLVFIDILYVILFVAISFAVLLFFAFSLVSQNSLGALLVVFILTFCFGILRFDLSDIPYPEELESLLEKKVTLKGKIVDDPRERESYQQLTVRADSEEGGAVNVLLTADFEGEYEYGDEITFSGVLKKPENFVTDQGKIFDYVNYLKKDRILYTISYADMEIISRGNGNPVKSFLLSLKNRFLKKIGRVVPEPESLLLGGLVLGEKAAFPEELRQQFVDTGTIHIVALSGYNITIVAEWFRKIFSFIGFNWGLCFGAVSIVLFVLMTGAGSTAVRAGIMAIISLLARAMGRGYDAGRALMLAGTGMVLFNPLILVHDVSFQLSLIATVAVIFLAPKIEKYFLWVTKSFGLRDVVSVTAAAYILVLPFILYKMGNLSLVALPANILILPFVPITMGLGFLAGLTGFALPVLSVPAGYLSYLFLRYELAIVEFFAGLPFAAFSFPNFPLVLTVVIYGYFAYKLFGRSIKDLLRRARSA